jgi:hypothetical protein
LFQLVPVANPGMPQRTRPAHFGEVSASWSSIRCLPEKLALVLEKLAQCDLPALWKPRATQFIRVDALPMLGTGKIDLRGVMDFAAMQQSVEASS